MYRLKSLKAKAFSFFKRPPIKRTPSIKWTLSRSRNESRIFPFITNPYSAETCIKWTRTLKLENARVKLISCLFIIHFYFIN